LIAKIFGEQNTVSTEKYIPAQNIRGLIAGLIIKGLKPGSLAHENPLFKDIILSGNVIFNTAFIKGALPIPNIYGYDKIKPESLAEFIFDKHLPLKGLSGMGEISNKVLLKRNVETTFSFHNSRSENRMAGRSTEEDGAIFYYEGIAPNQTFTSELIGSKSNLEYIKSLLAQFDGVHRMGKSKSAQYSKVKFTDFEITDWKNKVDKDLHSPAYLVFQSPVITYNLYGMAVPDLAILQTELESIIGCQIKQLSIASTSDFIENYMGVWQSKTPREAAFDIGTTLKVEFEGVLKPEIINKIELNGLGERKSEGYGRVIVIGLKEDLIRKSEDPDPGFKSSGIKVNPFNNVLLKNIFTEQLAQEDLNILKISALEQASKKRNKLPNSLISKLKDMLMVTDTLAAWKLKMDNLKDKKAYKTMEGANLWISISNLRVPDDPNNSSTFYIRKSYWLAYFNALRIKQIKTENNGI
jgi:CRISPR-associated protein Csx10